jgi:hypothetical protein
MHTAGLRLKVLALLGVVAATLAFSASASATPTKPYSLVICAFGASETCSPNPGPPASSINAPAAVPVGGKSVPMTATFTNENKSGTGIQMGSVNLTPPGGFIVSSPTIPCAGCTATVDANGIVELRFLAVPPGGTLKVSMMVDDSALPASACLAPNQVPNPTNSPICAWSAAVKQSNDFSGPPGNALTLDPGTSAPYAVIAQPQFTPAAQPANAAVTPTVITDQAFAPTGGPVTVTIVDANGARVGSYIGQVTVSLNPAAFAPIQGTLHGTVASNAVAGVATFNDLSVDSPGNAYSLTAMAADLPPSATSSAFDIAQSGETCDSKQMCKRLQAGSPSFATTDRGIDVTAGATATAGTLALSVDFGSLTGGQCEGYTAAHTEFLDLTAPGTETDTITTTVLLGTVTNTAIKNQDLCFASKQPFTELNDTTQPPSLTSASPTTLPDGSASAGFSGLLADCAPPGKKPTGLQVDPTTQPCVVSRSGTSNPLGGGTLSITSSSPIDSYKTG